MTRRATRAALATLLLTSPGTVVAQEATAQAKGRRSETVMAVSVLRPRDQCFPRRVAASGGLVARNPVDLRPERSGLVVSDLFIEPGDVVAKGQVLARLVPAQGPLQDGVAVKAPSDGLVISLNATEGAYVSPESKEPLVRLAEGSDLDVEVHVLASRLPTIQAKMPATISVLGLGDFKTQVISVADGVDAAAQLGTVRLSSTGDSRMRVGQFVSAEIITGEDCGLSVPLSALLHGPDGAIVGVVLADKVVMHRVTPGLLQAGDVEIREGLSPEDLVIVRAAPFLREGDLVHSVEIAP